MLFLLDAWLFIWVIYHIEDLSVSDRTVAIALSPNSKGTQSNKRSRESLRDS
ncbi:MAG: hypothetical protein PUP93_26750 [Rhizonema sp. NSF051]|nr:hypothetical protein [Rhizonema sp. NSF051]